MIVLGDDGGEVLAAKWEEDGDGSEQTISIFRYRYATDEVTASFYLTEQELNVLVGRMNGHLVDERQSR